MNPKFCPITRTLCEFISPARAKLLPLWKRLVCQKRGVQKMSFLLAVRPISTGYTSGWFEVMSWSWTKILNKVIGCPIFGSTFVWSSCSCFFNGLWFWAKFIFPTLGENLPNTSSYLLFFPPHRHVIRDPRVIKKVMGEYV